MTVYFEGSQHIILDADGEMEAFYLTVHQTNFQITNRRNPSVYATCPLSLTIVKGTFRYMLVHKAPFMNLRCHSTVVVGCVAKMLLRLIRLL